jgi:hypothetical protein
MRDFYEFLEVIMAGSISNKDAKSKGMHKITPDQIQQEKPRMGRKPQQPTKLYIQHPKPPPISLGRR